MPIPGVTNTVLDGGLGVTSPASSVPHIIGPGSAGPLNTPTLIANQRVWLELFNDRESPLADAVGYQLANAGGPVVVTRSAASVAATESAVAQSGAGPVITHDTPTSAPKNQYSVIVEITKAGAIGTSEYRFSLDGGRTFSQSFVTAATIALGTSGISADLAVGSYVLGERYTWTTTAPQMNATDLGTALDAAKLSQLTWKFFQLAGNFADADAAVLIFSALNTFLNGEASGPDRYFRALMNSGVDAAADVLTAFNAVTANRVGVLFNTAEVSAPFPSLGRGAAIMPVVNLAAMRAAGNLMSTDLGQTSGADSVGALPGVLSIGHDEFRAEAGLDAAKIGTTRTYSNTPGFFLTNVWLKSGPGSDFEFFQHGRIMDEACTVVAQQHQLLIGSNFEVKNDGSGAYTEAEAQGIEKRVQRALDQVIGSALRKIGPTRISGKVGHVSEFRYQVDRAQNVLSTKTHQASVGIVPLNYPKFFNTTFSFQLQV